MKKWVRRRFRIFWMKTSWKVWTNYLTSTKIKLNYHGSHHFLNVFFNSLQETWNVEVLASMLVTAWLRWWMYPLCWYWFFFMALRSFIYTLLSCLKCDYRTVAHNIKAAIALDLTGQTVQGISTLTSWQSSVTGKLNGDEFLSLWNKVTTFKVKNKKHVACDSEFLPDFIYIFF